MQVFNLVLASVELREYDIWYTLEQLDVIFEFFHDLNVLIVMDAVVEMHQNIFVRVAGDPVEVVAY